MERDGWELFVLSLSCSANASPWKAACSLWTIFGCLFLSKMEDSWIWTSTFVCACSLALETTWCFFGRRGWMERMLEDWIVGKGSNVRLVLFTDAFAFFFLLWSSRARRRCVRRSNEGPEEGCWNERTRSTMISFLLVSGCAFSSTKSSWMLCTTLFFGSQSLLFGKRSEATSIAAGILIGTRCVASALQELGTSLPDHWIDLGAQPAKSWETLVLLVSLTSNRWFRPRNVESLESTSVSEPDAKHWKLKCARAIVSAFGLWVSCRGIGKILYLLHACLAILSAGFKRATDGRHSGKEDGMMLAVSFAAIGHATTMCVLGILPINIERALPKSLGLTASTVRGDVVPLVLLGGLASCVARMFPTQRVTGGIDQGGKVPLFIATTVSALLSACIPAGFQLRGLLYITILSVILIQICVDSRRSRMTMVIQEELRPLLEDNNEHMVHGDGFEGDHGYDVEGRNLCSFTQPGREALRSLPSLVLLRCCAIFHLTLQYLLLSASTSGIWRPSQARADAWSDDVGFAVNPTNTSVLLGYLSAPLGLLLFSSWVEEASCLALSHSMPWREVSGPGIMLRRFIARLSGFLVVAATLFDSVLTGGWMGRILMVLLGFRWARPLSPVPVKWPRVVQAIASSLAIVGLYARQIPVLKKYLGTCTEIYACFGFPELSGGWMSTLCPFLPHVVLLVILGVEAISLHWVENASLDRTSAKAPWSICMFFEHMQEPCSQLQTGASVSTEAAHSWQIGARQQLQLQFHMIASNMRLRVDYFWELYGMGVLQYGLLIGAMLVTNVISLLYLFLLGALLLLQDRLKTRYLLGFALPVLAGILVWQFMLYTSCHMQFTSDDISREPAEAMHALRNKEWLAMVRPGPEYICVYFSLFALCMHQCYVKWICSRNELAAPCFKSAYWLPMNNESRKHWTYLDHIRFFVLGHSMDLVLLATFVFSTCERDVIHGGYFAITFWFFRKRDSLLQQKSNLYSLLQFFNFFVILLTLVYQVPQSLLKEALALESSLCNIQHLLGLYKMSGFGSCFRISAQGMWPDFLIFSLISIQASLFHHPVYEEAMGCLQESRSMAKVKLAKSRQEWRRKCLEAALDGVQASKIHRMQVQKLKAGVRKFSAAGEDNDEGIQHLSNLADSLPARKNSQKRHKIPSFLLLASPSLSSSSKGSFLNETEAIDGHEVDRVGLNLRRRAATWLSRFTSRLRWDSQSITPQICNVLFVLEYLRNVSLTSLPFLVAVMAYSIVGSPQRAYWTLMLIYAETMLLAQYIFGIPCNLDCFGSGSEGSGESLHGCPCCNLEWLGLHNPKGHASFLSGNWLLMVVYLSILLQRYSLHWQGYSGLDSQTEDSPDSLTVGPSPEGLGLEILRDQPDSSEEVESMDTGVFTCLAVFFHRMIKRTELEPFFVHFVVGINGMTFASERENIASVISTFLNCHGYSKERSQVSSLHVLSQQQEDDSKISVLVEIIPRKSYFYTKGFSGCPGADFAECLRSFAGQEVPSLAEKSSSELKIVMLTVQDIQTIHQPSRDTYALTFLFDALFFAFVAVTYQRAMHNTQSLVQSVYQQLFPYDYVFTLLLIFGLIVLDRVAYITKSHLYKTLLHYFNFVLFTSACSIVYWHGSSLKKKFVVIAFGIKCIAMFFSGRQLHFGYPHVTANYFFMHRVDYLTSYVFMLYYSIPFIHELRSILDWTCTETSLKLIDWMKLEDIRMTLFSVKASLLSRRNRYVGDKQPAYMKFFSGAVLFCLVCLVIWLPLMFYSTGNPGLLPNPLQNISVNATMVSDSGDVFDLFGSRSLQAIQYWEGLTKSVEFTEKSASRFPLALSGYTPEQMQIACVSPDADFLWLASPPLVKGLLNATSGGLSLEIGWSFVRQRPPDNRLLSVTIAHRLSESDKQGLRNMLQGNVSHSIQLGGMYGAFMHLPGEGSIELDFMQDKLPWTVNCSLHLKGDGWKSWWHMPCTFEQSSPLPTSSFQGSNLSANGCTNVRGPKIIAISERAPAGALGEAVGRVGIVGLYATFVLAVGRFLRLAVSDLQKQILFQDLPDVSRIEAIIQEIDAARAEGDLPLEEELYWTIVRIYRTPALLYELTLPSHKVHNVLPWALGSPKLKRE